jgi:hypothetical protein
MAAIASLGSAWAAPWLVTNTQPQELTAALSAFSERSHQPADADLQSTLGTAYAAWVGWSSWFPLGFRT